MNNKFRQGYYSGAKLRQMGFNSSQVNKFANDGVLFKVKHGLYKTSDINLNHQSFVDIATAYPKAIITGLSALAYYNLTTYIPEKVSMALPRGYNAPKIKYPPIETYYVSPKIFEADVNEVKDGKYKFRIYSMERTVCDAFRNRNKIGIDIAKEALTEYIRRKDKNIDKLYKTAVTCRIYSVMQPWMMAII